MIHVSRLQHKCVASIGRYPYLYFPLMSLRKHLGHSQGMAPLTQDTELVIDGFYRSANGFAIRAFLSAQSQKVIIANRTHVPATIIRAAKWNIPILVLIREPKDTIISYLMKWPHLTAVDGLNEYISYYSAILPYHDHYVVASFKDVTTDFGMIIERLNSRFGTQFDRFIHDDNSTQEVFSMLSQRDMDAFGEDTSMASIPLQQKGAIKARYKQMLESSELRALVTDAESVYQRFLSQAASVSC